MTGSFGYLSIPVLQTLHFIHNKKICMKRLQDFYIIANTVVRYYLVEFFSSIQQFSGKVISFYNNGLGIGKTLYLLFPLIF
ncbi:unknown [Bacteroides sp. CAG:530]|nr:unknown [Bacteroides sp. CAG:530]